ncbi:MAG: hypothetical protein H6867_07350 [Rhodospirillales bacterium]|nr:hypothetical protein [Rhodospirillales bacterium]MCB9995367.1 hypothetical protein [Rhodospirillales bacterium]
MVFSAMFVDILFDLVDGILTAVSAGGTLVYFVLVFITGEGVYNLINDVFQCAGQSPSLLSPFFGSA